MAFRYLIYRTDFGNTIVRESPTDTSTGGTEASLFTDFIIPQIQPLYLWRVTGGTTVVPNLDSNINDWLNNIAPPLEPEDTATVGYVTGITENKIDKVTGATDNIAIFESDGNVKDGGFTIPELTGLTTYSFSGSGGTTVTQVGNAITVFSAIPTGTTVSWGDIVGTLSNQTDLQNALDAKLDEADFTGYTATTDSRLDTIENNFNSYTGTTDGRLDTIESEITGLTATTSGKLDTSVFTGYTATTQPVIDAALTGVTNLGTGTTLLTVSGRNVESKSISVLGGLTITGDADNLIISGETNPSVVWGNITGTLSDQTDLWNTLTGITADTASKLDTAIFTGYTATTETRLQGIETDISAVSAETVNKLDTSTFVNYTGVTDLRLQGIESDIVFLSGQTDLKLNISDFNTYTGTTETRLQGIENDITGITANTVSISDFNSYTGTTDTRLDNIESDIDALSAATINSLTGATNGLSVIGGDVELGGTLIKDTVISGITSDFTLNVADIILQATGTIDILDTGGNNIDIETDGGTIDIVGNTGLSVEQTKLTIGPSQMLITDSRATPRGIEYNADYSATFNPESLITKRYADAIVSGLDLKESVKVATTTGDTNLDLTGGTFGGTIDGYTVQDGDRVLIKNQVTNPEQNGIWVYSSGGNTFGRAIDFVDPNVTSGAFTFIETGSTLAASGWVLVTQDPITIGVTPLTFTQFSAAGSFIGGVGIDITGNVISIDGTSLAGSSIAFTGNTFNVDPTTGNLAIALGTKLDISLFDSYTGTTDTRLTNIESDIATLSGDTAGKLDESIFTGYTATTETRLTGIESDITFISGVTDTKLDIDVFTGYTASTAVVDERLQLVATGATNINTVAVTEIDWHIVQFSASSYNWSGGSGIFIQETGDYKVSYKIGLNNGSGSAIRSVGAYLILNNSSTIVESAGAATLAGGTSISEAITSPSTILSLSAGDRIDLAGFRIGNAGTVNTVNESVTILIERID
jgi:hypothetical protein